MTVHVRGNKTMRNDVVDVVEALQSRNRCAMLCVPSLHAINSLMGMSL